MFDDITVILAWGLPLLHAIGVVVAVTAVMRTRTSQGSIAWALSLVFLPYVALPLYVVFGRDRFEGYRRRLRLSISRQRGQSISALDAIAAHRATLVGRRSEDQRVIERICGQVFTRGNKVRLLIDGGAKFPALFKAVKEAKRDIVVQYYIMRDDEVGRQLMEALIERARAGVRVQVLYDGLGCFFLPRGYICKLRDAGAQVLAFRTSRFGRSGIQVNFRNHRKVVIVDGKEAFLGGINVGDEYMGKVPRYGAWRDTHVAVTGPAVLELQMAFAADWHWASGTVPTVSWEPQPVETPAQGVLPLSSGPADDLERLAPLLLHLITGSARRVWIATPYFVPDPATLAALRIAALRGLDVRILMPEGSDQTASYLAAFTYYPSCTEAGVRIFRYTAGFMHQKVWLFDDDMAAVGSVNIDNRSLRLNFEQMLLVCDKGFAGEVEAMLTADMLKCREVGPREFTARPWHFRLAARVCRLLEPVL